MWRRVALGACISVVCLSARADERGAMAAGLAAYQALDYERAVELLDQALAHAERLEDKVAILRALAFSHVGLEQLDEARAELRLLVRLDPAATLDRTVSPRVRLLLEEVKADLERPTPAPPPLVAALDPPRPRAGQPVAFTALAAGGARAELHYRTRGEAGFSQVEAASQDGRFALRVPGGDVKAPAFEYYVVALDGRGAAAGSAGAPDRPLAVEVEAPPPKREPIYRRPWFWVTVAGVVTTAVVAGAVAATVGSPSSAHVIIQR